MNVDFKDIEKLEKNLERIPGMSEEVINSVLKKQGVRKVVEGITKLIKIGDRGGPHARSSKWEKVENFNLGFNVKTKGGAAKNRGSFGYLVFPNEGRGPRNHMEQRFAERGLEAAESKVIEDLSLEIEKKIQEVL